MRMRESARRLIRRHQQNKRLGLKGQRPDLGRNVSLHVIVLWVMLALILIAWALWGWQ